MESMDEQRYCNIPDGPRREDVGLPCCPQLFGQEHLLIGMDMVIASFDSISEVNMAFKSFNKAQLSPLTKETCNEIFHDVIFSVLTTRERKLVLQVVEYAWNKSERDYTLTLYLNQFWTDERLKFSKENYELTLSGDFAEKYGFTTTLACMMDLHYYPLDSQNCTVEIESYGYTVADVVMYWTATPVVGVEDAELPQFSIMKYETTNRMEKLATALRVSLVSFVVANRTVFAEI
ncbi:gamma-aminobutyric acid receptor subunit beta-like [Caerostris extrusa]|uniref:Gamma-aminobutyric acid receptor subunit beta-like n=1 Tax=Caerostris extrusa TaxID=172846 RepID=A0AAV4Q740_CAEEX|nr:gamma-aminobutyric acid receptor subunit beta-like [Caerostris extrusa]